MSAYLIAHVTVKDTDKMQDYAGQATASIEASGGRVVTRSQVTEVLAGSHADKACVIIEFPDGDSLRNWYRSDTYQALVPLRREAAEMTLIVAEEPSQ
jgi:uncharacterized protein (DUF1330 family)